MIYVVLVEFALESVNIKDCKKKFKYRCRYYSKYIYNYPLNGIILFKESIVLQTVSSACKLSIGILV